MTITILCNPVNVMVYRDSTSVAVQFVADLTALPLPSGALTGGNYVLTAQSDVHTPPNETGDYVQCSGVQTLTNASRVYTVPSPSYGRTVTVAIPAGARTAIAQALGTSLDLAVVVTGTTGSTGSYTTIESLQLQLSFSDPVQITGDIGTPNYKIVYTPDVRHRYRGARESRTFISASQSWMTDVVRIGLRTAQLSLDDKQWLLINHITQIQHCRQQLTFLLRRRL